MGKERQQNEPKRIKFDSEKLSTCSDSDSQSADDSTGLNSPPTQKESGVAIGGSSLPVWLEQERHRPYFPLFLGAAQNADKQAQATLNQYQLALDLRMKMLQQTPFASPMANPLAQHLYLKAKEAFVQRNFI